MTSSTFYFSYVLSKDVGAVLRMRSTGVKIPQRLRKSKYLRALGARRGMAGSPSLGTSNGPNAPASLLCREVDRRTGLSVHSNSTENIGTPRFLRVPYPLPVPSCFLGGGPW